MKSDKNVKYTRTTKHIRSRSFKISRFRNTCFVVLVPFNIMQTSIRNRNIYAVSGKSLLAHARRMQILLRKLGIRLRDLHVFKH
jgi:hypothetical protein